MFLGGEGVGNYANSAGRRSIVACDRMADGSPKSAPPPKGGGAGDGAPDYFALTPAQGATTPPERADPVVPADHPWAAMLAPPTLPHGGSLQSGSHGGLRTPLTLPRTPGLPRTPHIEKGSETGASLGAPPTSGASLGVPGGTSLGVPGGASLGVSGGAPSLAVPGASGALHTSPPSLLVPPAAGRSHSIPSGPDAPGARAPTPSLPRGALAGAARVPQKARALPPSDPAVESGRVQPISAADLAAMLAAGDSGDPVLLVDIRPATAFSKVHIRDSVNLCAPSTLLKRAEFTLDRLESQMLDPGAERDAFSVWRRHGASGCIVALDTDATSPTSMGRSTSGGGGPCLVGLLRKFDQEKYPGRLRWLHGGFSAFKAQEGARAHLVHGDVDLSHCAAPTQPEIVRPRGLSLDAFRLTTSGVESAAAPPVQATNPFFDNIRQNLELSCGITDVVPLEMDLTEPQKARLPRFLQNLLEMPSKERADHLAQQFFEVEKSEQERLRGVMARHTHDSFNGPASGNDKLLSARAANPLSPTERPVCNDHFPLSITAALERGMDNRYRNLWTFEHSRVKLAQPIDAKDAGSNYLNASFINPLRHLGGHRVYLATQAPLPVTFEAFWEALWEQECHVIVMLSREFEAGRQQCHKYWDYTSHRLRVHVEKEELLRRADLGLDDKSGGAIALRRTLVLSHADGTSPRRIVQLQYLDWPDHSVPDSADELLALARLADEARLTHKVPGPYVVHCSAGIGRTGALIAIDSVLAYLRSTRSMPGTGPTPEQAHEAWHGQRDLIFEALSVMREQRMSMVQTVRQYVFAYRAVIEALLA